jgi:hypothetical protein
MRANSRHPAGRLENLHSLAAKQREPGVAQLQQEITTVRAFIAQEANRGRGDDAASKRPLVVEHLTRVAAMRRRGGSWLQVPQKVWYASVTSAGAGSL